MRQVHEAAQSDFSPSQAFLLGVPWGVPWRAWKIEDGGKIVAHRSLSREAVGFLGFYEINPRLSPSERLEVSGTLIRSATDWLTSQGVRTAMGPLDWTTWFNYRAHLGEPESLFFWEPTYTRRVADDFLAAGFRTGQTFHSSFLDAPDEGPLQRFLLETQRALERVLQQGYSARSFTQMPPSEILPLCYSLSMAGFRDNYLFDPIPWVVFEKLYGQMMARVSLDHSFFVFDTDRNPVAFIFSFIDQGYVLTKSGAVLPAHREKKLSVALTHLSLKSAYQKEGIFRVGVPLVRSGNRSEFIAAQGKEAGFRVTQHDYALFEKILN